MLFHRMCLPLFTSLFLVSFFPGFLNRASAQENDSVVVIANRSVSGSVKVAKAYMKGRDIPKENLIVVTGGRELTISRSQYIKSIHNPVLETLLERELINALAGSRDRYGRDTVTIISNPLEYMVLCFGMPTIVGSVPNQQLPDLDLRKAMFRGNNESLVDKFSSGPLAVNNASVDGELALILRKDIPFNGFTPNPYYNNPNPERVRDVLKVTRLDGPSVKAVLRLLENTWQGEREGLKGRAYVDEDGRGGSYAMGNNWLSKTARTFADLGFDVQHDKRKENFGMAARFDAPVLYAGWYATTVRGPFKLPDFQFPPGAVAAHLHSTSARSIRSADQGWVGPFVDRGVSATFGNVAEPYLRFTHHFDLFFESLAKGSNLADAAYFALPVLSWQAVTIGDPLYRPFAKTQLQQLVDVGSDDDTSRDEYVFIREYNLLLKDDQKAAALSALDEGMRKSPGPALALQYARALLGEERQPEALEAVKPFRTMDLDNPLHWRLFENIANQIRQLGDPGTAFAMYVRLIDLKTPPNVQLAFMRRGLQAAEEAGETAVAEQWRAKVSPSPSSPEPDPNTSAPSSGKAAT